MTVFDSLPSDTQDAVLEALFSVNFSASPSPPIGLSLMRHTIGQSDLTPASIGEWSFDSTPNDVPDPSLAHFNLTAPGERMVSWLQRMLTVTANASTTLLGSIWSPPQWMKNNNNLRFEQVDAWVGYLVKYLLAYRENGVNVDAITMQVGRSVVSLVVERQHAARTALIGSLRCSVSETINVVLQRPPV